MGYTILMEGNSHAKKKPISILIASVDFVPRMDWKIKCSIFFSVAVL